MSDKKSKNQNKRQVGPTITLHSDPNDKNNKKKKNRDDVLLDHFNFAKDPKLQSTKKQLASTKFTLNSPLQPTQPIMFRTTSTPMVGSEMEKLKFNYDSDSESNISLDMLIDEDNTCEIIPLLPTQSINTAPKKRIWMLASEKLKLGLLSSKPKFCPFCNYVCESKINYHIKAKHYDQLRYPVTTSADAINKIILTSARKNKILVPLNRIINIMGNYWSDPEMRKISYELCMLGRLTIYGKSWNLEHVPDIPNPFTQYIIKTH